MSNIKEYVCPDTDGVVSASSARAEGSAWRGVAIEAPDTDHSGLINDNEGGEDVLERIFLGTEPQTSNAFGNTFNINR